MLRSKREARSASKGHRDDSRWEQTNRGWSVPIGGKWIQRRWRACQAGMEGGPIGVTWFPVIRRSFVPVHNLHCMQHDCHKCHGNFLRLLRQLRAKEISLFLSITPSRPGPFPLHQLQDAVQQLIMLQPLRLCINLVHLEERAPGRRNFHPHRADQR